MRAAARGLVLGVLPALLLPACAGQDVRGESNAVARIARMARENGARRCAPKKLALAEVHLRRARDELDLGNLIPAKEHLAIANANAQEAFKRSPRDRCAPRVVIPEKKIEVVRQDRDRDGCYDDEDRCPAQAEDRDGFQDEDCCPDPDNDADSIADQADRCPNEPEDRDGFQDADGCPDPDNDGDGLADLSDRCPMQPEDWDGFQDADGCPDPDNDGDRIADVDDRCPEQPEDYDGDQDKDGCPDKYKLVVVTKKKIELKQKVFFATGKSRILPRSFELLNEVAKALSDNPTLVVRIEGHTDSRGSARYNRRLSRGRARSVRRYLIRRGIDPDRLEAVGYGEDRPIANNRTRAGRAMNRRVEFVIIRK